MQYLQIIRFDINLNGVLLYDYARKKNLIYNYNGNTFHFDNPVFALFAQRKQGKRCTCQRYICMGGAESVNKPGVILVTDGDSMAKKAVEAAAANIGGRCISASAGNPTGLTGAEIVERILQAPYDPVVIMVDDRGEKGAGSGEKALAHIARSDKVDLLGVVAVSSNGKDCRGIDVSCSVTSDGDIIESSVDKSGTELSSNSICGDTLSVLRGMKSMTIVGMGDPGKMDFKDDAEKGAPVTTKALEEIVKRSKGKHQV